jgi:hypothetical protein
MSVVFATRIQKVGSQKAGPNLLVKVKRSIEERGI